MDEGVVGGLWLPLLPIFVGVPMYADEFELGNGTLDERAVGYVGYVEFMLGGRIVEVAFDGDV